METKVKPESPTPWLICLSIVAVLVVVSLCSGCAATQSLEVGAVYRGERPEIVASYKVVK